MTTALIDADILRYEVGSVGQDKEGNIRSFDFVKDVFDERIRTITESTGATETALYLTGDRATHRIYTKRNVGGEFIPNFREALAKGKVYKGTRNKERPFHWLNLTAYILSKGLDEHTSVNVANGYEADDAMAIEAFNRRIQGDTIICSRDKDLRMVPGIHYGWECGKQPEFGPVTYDNLGTINLIRSKSGNKITGGGFKFFCSQVLTGDVVDNIGGAKGCGPVMAYALLADCATERECFRAVQRYYENLDSERWKGLLEEQCHLLWIIRELNEDGSLKHFNMGEWL